MADIIFPGQAPDDSIGNGRLPSNVDMVFWRGDSQTYVIKLNAENGDPILLNGYTAKAAMKAGFDSSTRFDFVCTIQNGNEVKLYLSSATSKSIPAGSYIWDFKLVETATGDTRTYLAGDITVYDEVDDA